LFLSAAFMREDETIGVFERKDVPDPGNPGALIATFTEKRVPAKNSQLNPSPNAANVGQTFTDFVIDAVPTKPTTDVAPTFTRTGLTRRHTEEIGIWQGTPGTFPQNALFPAFA